MHHHSGHFHGHTHGHGYEGARAGNIKGLVIALVITSGIALLEFFGGIVTRSLALLSDAGHMLSDASSLLLSLLAIWFAGRAPTATKTFGYYRLEILAAFLNGLTLFVIAGFIIWEAYQRIFDPPTVASGTMILIAMVGLLANLISAWTLIRQGDVKENLNLRSAYLHVLGDALGSVGAILAGIVMYFFGWYIFDPIISVFVALLILRGAWGIITQTVHILMEGTPPSMNKDEVSARLGQIEGVIEVHDLHIWTITSGIDSLSCHLVVESSRDSQDVLQTAIDLLEQQFSLTHVTIQIEAPRTRHAELLV
ncbi:cation transporter [Paenibacillus lentus]|uniref:Cation transporter n=2 Tax=Paenibacillus lentus TaxID=1338368 RepID=A0A3Q8S7M8_9BACL|nr:cation transporter [Paenibacillus lentus]